MATVGQVLYGTYAIPTASDQPLDINVNPCGNLVRSQKRWAFSFESETLVSCTLFPRPVGWETGTYPLPLVQDNAAYLMLLYTYLAIACLVLVSTPGSQNTLSWMQIH